MQKTAGAQGANTFVAQLDAKSLMMSAALLAVMAMLMFTPVAAHAQDLPWDSATCKAAKAFTGPWLGWVAAISVALAGVCWGIGEAKAPLQTVMRIAAGFSVAVSAFSVTAWLMPSMSSYLASAAC